MKRMSKVFAVLAIVLVATFSASADNSKKISNDKVTVTICDLAPNADMTALKACYTVTVAPDAVEPCESIILTPTIKVNGKKEVVEVIVVNGSGKLGSTKWVECKVYEVCDPNKVRFVTLKKSEDLVIKSCYDIPFESWMDDASFDVTTQRVTYSPKCIKPYPGEEFICEIPYLTEPLEIMAVPQPYVPQFEAAEKRVVETKLYYPVNGIQKVTTYLRNADALAVIDALDEPGYDVKSVTINGWASPESSVSYNQNLSNNRAKTLKKIIADKYKFNESVYVVNGKGEYWGEVEEYINNSEEPVIANNRDALKAALASTDDLDKKEAAIKKVAGGKPYANIFKAVYPTSRFADCVIEYTAKEFTLEDAKLIYKNNPKDLAADSYALWAMQEFDEDVVKKALEIYPDDQKLNAVIATIEYQNGNYEKAAECYKNAGNDPVIMNNLGCCYLKLGNAEAAKACFEKAGDSREAASNAKEVRRVVLNNKYFAK